jgi:hypothetical protein
VKVVHFMLDGDVLDCIGQVLKLLTEDSVLCKYAPTQICMILGNFAFV